MKFDKDVFVRVIRRNADAYGVPQPSAQHGGREPPADPTAAAVLYAIAEAMIMATDETEQK